MDSILLLDYFLFSKINHLPHTGLSNWIAQLISGFELGWVLWLIIGAALFLREERKDHRFILPAMYAGLMCYDLSEFLLKHLFARPRPSLLTNAIVVGFKPDGYSFPSTHATIAFAFAYLFSLKEPKYRMWFYLLAVLVGLSRIYLGHHYPTDVIAGSILGTVIGIGSRWMEFLSPAVHRRPKSRTKHRS